MAGCFASVAWSSLVSSLSVVARILFVLDDDDDDDGDGVGVVADGFDIKDGAKKDDAERFERVDDAIGCTTRRPNELMRLIGINVDGNNNVAVAVRAVLALRI